MKNLSAKARSLVIAVSGNILFVVYCLYVRYSVDARSMFSSFGLVIGLLAGGIFILCQFQSMKEALSTCESLLSWIVTAVVRSVLITCPVFVYLVCPPEPVECAGAVNESISRALWIAPLLTIAFFVWSWFMTQPTFDSPKKVKDMSPADFSQVKSTMNLAHVDPDKAAPFISDETANMSASDWNSLARDLDLAGIDIKRKKNR